MKHGDTSNDDGTIRMPTRVLNNPSMGSLGLNENLNMHANPLNTVRDGSSASFGESIANLIMNPSRSLGGEGVIEFGSAIGYLKVPFPNSSIGMDTNTFPDGDGIGVSTHAGRFVSNLSTMEGASLHTNMGASFDVHEGIGNFAANSSKDIPQQHTDSSTTIGTNSSQRVHDSNVQTHSIDDVAKLFGVPLNTLKDIDDFVQDLNMPKGAPIVDDLSTKASPNADNLSSKDSPSDPIVQSMDTNTKYTSYVGAAGASTMAQPQVNSNFCPLVVDPVFNGVNISIPCKVAEKISARLEHTLYGWFRSCFGDGPIYYNPHPYVNTHRSSVTENVEESKVGLEVVLESGPWMIRNTLIILKKWSMSTSLLKEEDEDGISLIATFIGKRIMLDSYTSFMCKDSDDFTKETIRVEYEWRPPRCDKCKIFGHVHDHCPKKVVIVTTSTVVAPTIKKSNDGFQTVGKKKKRKGKSKSTNGGQFTGPSVKQTVRYEPKATPSAPKKGATNVSNPSKSSSMLKIVETSPKKMMKKLKMCMMNWLICLKRGSSSFAAAAG
ncbi:hypothetical protein Tco_1156591 [Tanacetum coccineum]